MPIVRLEGVPTINGEPPCIYVLQVDRDGEEVMDAAAPPVSDALLERMAGTPRVTDVILFVHGFNTGDTGENVVRRYRKWATSMCADGGGLEVMRARPGGFVPLLVGIHWPSMVHRYVKAAVKNRTLENVGRALLEGAFRAADVLVRAADEGDDFRDPLGTLTKHTPEEMFGRYQERAKQIGNAFAYDLIEKLMHAAERREAVSSAAASAAPPIAFHGIAHSLGCHVLCAAVDGELQEAPLPRPLHSLVLIQGAVEADCFGAEGEYASVPRRLSGVLLVTRSDSDEALKLYAMKYGAALGHVGAQKLDDAIDVTLESGGAHPSWFYPGNLLNVNASLFIRPNSDAIIDFRGGHSNFGHATLVRMFWLALATGVDRS